MQPTLVVLCVVQLICVARLNAQQVAKEEDEPIPAFKQGIRFDTFDLNFCKALYSAAPGNAALSPVSVKLLLGMVYEAASGDSARQIQQALAMGDRRSSRSNFKAILNSLECESADASCAVRLQSRLFITDESAYSVGYRRVLYTHFAAEVQQANFSHPAEAAAIINNWACNATENRVKQIISTEDVAQAKMVLANTLLFKGTWEVPFNPASTAKGDFRLKDNRTVQVDMMRVRGKFFVVQDDKCAFTLIRLPYKGGQFSFYLVLPNEVDGLSALVQQLTPESIRESIMQMKQLDVHLTLPKFTITHKVDIKSILIQLGITKVFSQSEAELPKLSKDNSVYVSRVVHEAGLEVDETGSTAFAATQVQMSVKMASEPDKFVVMDRPFAVFIKDDVAETVVFAAKVADPSKPIPQARALAQTAPTAAPTLYPPNFFPSSLNETKVLLQKLNSTSHLEPAAEVEGHSVIMRIQPKKKNDQKLSFPAAD